MVEPREAVEFAEFAREKIAEGGEVPDVERGVVEEFRRDGAAGPVGLLAVFIELDAEVFLEEGGKADALAAEQLGRQHGVE